VSAARHNPCVACGACCAYFRVSFHWSEADAAVGGATPAALTTKIAPHHSAMAGTETHAPRCVALAGQIGRDVRCAIYSARPSPCRELQASWVNGARSERCDRARAAHGLPPLERPLDERPAAGAPGLR
jgi:uncharacterized protein